MDRTVVYGYTWLHLTVFVYEVQNSVLVLKKFSFSECFQISRRLSSS